MTDNASHATETNYRPDCKKLPEEPKVPDLPESGKCPEQCNCPGLPGGQPQSCLDNLIEEQNIIVKKAERAKAFADELTEIQNKVKSAQADYTQARYVDLRKTWKAQDGAIVELIRKLVCAVDCWECLLECRLCKQLVEIRKLEDQLNGPPGDEATRTGQLTTEIYSLFDQKAWHERNVAQMEARMKRITDVMAAWEKPASTLGEVIEKNGNLITESQSLIASDSAKVVYDVFMTLIPRHLAIQPRGPGLASDWESGINARYNGICECQQTPAPKPQEAGKGGAANQDAGKQPCEDDGDDEKCKCDDGMPDDCCGPDVGILNLRQRLIGPLPYIVDPAIFPAMICCITTNRLSPASDQLAAAQANLAASIAKIELVKKQLAEKKAGIEANFREALPNPIDCRDYTNKKTPPATPMTPNQGNQGDTTQHDHTVS